MNQNLSRIVRALRKTNNFNQKEFSTELNIAQGTLSKVEAGNLDIATGGLLYLMKKYRIDHNTIYSGYVELDYIANLKETGFKIGSDYKLVSRYSSRHIAVMRLAIEMNFDEFDALLKNNLRVDPDILSILNHPISEKMFKDIEKLVQTRFYNKEFNIQELLEYDNDIPNETDTINFVSSFAKKSKEYFDSEIEIETETENQFTFNLISKNETLHNCANLAFKSIQGKLKLKIKTFEKNKTKVEYLTS